MIKKLRIASLLGIHVLIFLHIYVFGDSIIGSLDFQEFFHAFIKYGIINAGVVMVIIAFISTLIFGRFFCGWACHFGAVQEFSWWVLNKCGIKPITINSSLVTILPFFILLNFYLAPNLIYLINEPWEGLTVNLGIPEIWTFLPGFLVGLATFIIDGFLIVYFLGRKGFCRYLCPWGAFLKFPNSLAMYKIRNTGGCIDSGLCTSNCPIGIDVNYEINHYQKVTNTNCTSCMVCTEGCPSNAITFKWENPLKEQFNINYYKKNEDMFQLKSIKNKFQSIYKRDFIYLLLIIIFGFSIDGLYGMGHFLSFGIATISVLQFIVPIKGILRSKRKLLISLLFIITFFWHGLIKYSIWQGLKNYDEKNYIASIYYLKKAVAMYPQPIGRYHVLLGRMYFEIGDIINAKHHADIAKKINPSHSAPTELLNQIKLIDKE